MIILAERRFGPMTAKTASGAIAYRPEEIVAVIDSSRAGATVQDILGYGGAIPIVASLEEGMQFTPDTLLIGIAPPGGYLPESWRETLRKAVLRGLHIISGLHFRLNDDAELTRLAEEHHVVLTDLRKPPDSHKVVARGTWKNRKAKTILGVGTDCRIGKMTTILEVEKVFRQRGARSRFIATGQTGILICGRGISVDAMIGDYIAGSIEKEIDAAADEGADYIFVEGQGALTHQGYSSVTMGLMHGTMPDAMIMVHQPTRERDDYGFTIPPLLSLIQFHEDAIRFFKPSKVVGIGINSVGLSPEESTQATLKIERETGLPAIDAFRFGGEKLADALQAFFRL